jgi:hypothetical protein
MLPDGGNLPGFLHGGEVNFHAIEQMETRIGGAAMNSLPGYGGANGITSFLCALERDRAEQETNDTGCEMRGLYRPLGPEVWRQKVGSGLPADWHRQEAERLRRSDTRLRVPFLTCSVTASGPLRRPAAGSLFCFCCTTPPRNERASGTPDFAALRVAASIEICFGKYAEKIYDGPSANAELRPWESRPLA